MEKNERALRISASLAKLHVLIADLHVLTSFSGGKYCTCFYNVSIRCISNKRNKKYSSLSHAAKIMQMRSFEIVAAFKTELCIFDLC